jgi:hypothetical protein
MRKRKLAAANDNGDASDAWQAGHRDGGAVFMFTAVVNAPEGKWREKSGTRSVSTSAPRK